MDISLENGGLYIQFRIEDDGRVGLRHFAAHPYAGQDRGQYYPLLEMHCLGHNIDGHHGSRHTLTYPAALLRYANHQLVSVPGGRELTIRLQGGGFAVDMHYRMYDDIPVVQSYAEVENTGDQKEILDYLTSFVYYGISDMVEGSFEDTIVYDIPFNTWHGELQWHQNTAWEMGIPDLDCSSLRRATVSQLGSWSSGEYAPVGVIENRQSGESFCWQIEHNGSWSWESGTLPGNGLYLQLTGPNGEQHGFEKVLLPGDRFCSVPVAFGAAADGFDGAIGALTRYRRCIRRPNEDNRRLPVIFNDYMNCLMGDPTEEKILPLVEAAAAIGCEYYVMDAGWFSEKEGGDDDWWSSIGIWKEASFRFPHGISYVMDYIRDHGMVPGIWVELEGIGPDCPLAKTLPDDWFFMRDGRRVMQHYRYQLDYRNPAVRDFATGVVDDLVRQYHVGYLKLDYNINAGAGTDHEADSVGEGLLEHNRAFLGWLDSIFERYPDLIIENCASGGMRMDYATLRRLSIQSTSDQLDYRQYSIISAMAATAVTPEQGACWTYPSTSGDEEETVFNMVNALLGRVHQSGFINRLPESTCRLIREALDRYREIRPDIREGVPVFPLGIVTFRSPWAAYGIRCGRRLYLSVWRRHAAEDTVDIPLHLPTGTPYTVSKLYPADFPVEWECRDNHLRVTLPRQYTARILRIDF